MIGIPWTRIKCSAVHNVLYDILSFQIKYGFFVDLTLILAILIRIVGWLLPFLSPKNVFSPFLFVCLFVHCVELCMEVSFGFHAVYFVHAKGGYLKVPYTIS